ncbi:PucR family transcriptional regulator [Moorella sulfitireducens]|uniref:PucR family transcriptional regulator n=1 Tax=Neomoorella sulfitireducens TaxID=2972948 RepID=UPI0021AC5EBB
MDYVFTVADLLNLQVMSRATVIAGKGGLNRPVTSVTVLDAPDAIQWVRGQEFVVTTLYPFKDSQELQLFLIQELSRYRAAALGIKLRRFLEELPEAVLRVANEADLPVINIPYECAWIDIINPVLAEIMNRQLLELRRSEEIHQALTQEVLRGGDLNSVASALGSLVNNPVTIYEFITYSHVNWPTEFTCQQDENILKPWHAGPGETICPWPRHPEVLRITGIANCRLSLPIRIGKRVEGQIIVWEKERTFQESDIVAMEHAATVAALYLQRIRAIREVNQRFRDDFLEHLLRGEVSRSSSLQERGMQLGWQPKEKNIVIVATVAATSYEAIHKFFEQVNAFFARHNCSSILTGIDHHDRVIIIYPLPEETSGSEAANIARELTGALAKEMTARFKLAPFNLGIGRPAACLEEIPRSYQEACTAQSLGFSLNGPGSTTTYDDLGVYRLLQNYIKTAETDRFLEDFILPIIRWDEANHSQLLVTLEIFLNCGCNYRLTARKLYLHHNTVRYRLETIQQITGYDPNLPEARLNFHLALKLYRLLQAKI